MGAILNAMDELCRKEAMNLTPIEEKVIREIFPHDSKSEKNVIRLFPGFDFDFIGTLKDFEDNFNKINVVKNGVNFSKVLRNALFSNIKPILKNGSETQVRENRDRLSRMVEPLISDARMMYEKLSAEILSADKVI